MGSRKCLATEQAEYSRAGHCRSLNFRGRVNPLCDKAEEKHLIAERKLGVGGEREAKGGVRLGSA